jgi:predicted nucleic acid-binding protein
MPLPGGAQREILGGFLEAPWMTSRLVPDAHLAALAIEHGLTLQSTDGDFAKFPDLKWENPLAA